MNAFLAILASLAQNATPAIQIAQQGGLIKSTSKVPAYVALGSIIAGAVIAGVVASKSAQNGVPASA